MGYRLLAALVLVVAGATASTAQNMDAERFRFLATDGITVLRVDRVGVGSPEGVQAGSVGDTYTNTTSGQLYFKLSGTATTTGWVTWTNANTASAIVSRDGSGGFSMGALVATVVTDSGLTSGRVPIASTAGLLADDADLTFATDTLSATKVAMSSLTSGRVPIVSTSGLLIDDADFTFATDTLSATKVAMSSLTSGRVPFSSTAGLQIDDADLTFATDTLTSTKLVAPTSISTPLVIAAASLTLNPAGDLITDPVGNDILPVTNYDINLGAINLKYLTLHAAELWVETLVAQNTIATIGGRVLVAPTTPLCADLAAGATTMDVKYNQMASGDIAYLEADGKVEFILMGSQFTTVACGPVTGYRYNITTRNLDGTGANQWYAGDAVLNTGTTGKGFIDLYSLSGVLSGSGPTIVGNVRTGTTYSNIEPRWAIGNLNGLYGYASELYGAAFGSPSAAWIKIDSTNGVRIGHNATTVTQIDASGNASFTGTLTSGDGLIGGWTLIPSQLYSGAGATRVGICSSSCSGYAFYAGDNTVTSAPFRVTAGGALTSTSGAIGGFTIGANSLTSSAGNMGFDSTDNGVQSDVQFWVGGPKASAPFGVLDDGRLHAAATSLSGALNGTSISMTGAITGGILQGSGRMDITNSASGDVSAAFVNTHASGYGIYVRGGGASNYALAVAKYDGTSALTVLGNGDATFGGSVVGASYSGGAVSGTTGIFSTYVGNTLQYARQIFGNANSGAGANDVLYLQNGIANIVQIGNGTTASGLGIYGTLTTTGANQLVNLAGTGNRYVCTDVNGSLYTNAAGMGC